MSKKQQKKDPLHSLSLPPEEIERLNSILEDPSRLQPSTIGDQIQSESLALAFLQRVPLESTAAVDLVLAIQEAFPQKEVQRAARKTLFRLKQRGMEIPARKGDGPPLFSATPAEGAEEPSAYISPPDGLGTRAVFLIIPRVPAGVDLGMGVVSDEKGLIEFVFGRYSKKKAKEMREIFFQAVPHLFGTSISHAATILESGYTKGKSGTHSQAGEYQKIRPWLIQRISPQKSPVDEWIPPGDAPEPTLSQVEKLMSHDWMVTWIIEQSAISPLVEQIAQAEQSAILISAEQKETRKQDLKESFVARFYTEERKQLLKRRLEETAYLFHRAGEEDYARIALGSALSLEEKDSGLKANVFLKDMVERSLNYYFGSVESAEPEPEKTPSGLILPG